MEQGKRLIVTERFTLNRVRVAHAEMHQSGGTMVVIEVASVGRRA
jgi:hypothetical protein